MTSTEEPRVVRVMEFEMMPEKADGAAARMLPARAQTVNARTLDSRSMPRVPSSSLPARQHSLRSRDSRQAREVHGPGAVREREGAGAALLLPEAVHIDAARVVLGNAALLLHH